MLTGVLVNSGAILICAILGTVLGRFISERVSNVIQLGIAMATIAIGIKMALEFHSIIIFIGCTVAGGILGTLMQIENRLEAGVKRLQGWVMRKKPSRFAEGLTSTSVLYCSGAMAVVGSINSGVMHDHQILYTKSLIDGIYSIPMAGMYGIGVAFSAIPVLLYQGTITLLASELSFLSNPHAMADISGVGGLLILMIGLHVGKIIRVPVADFLPSIGLVFICCAFLYS